MLRSRGSPPSKLLEIQLCLISHSPKLGHKTADKLLLAFRLLISSLLNPALSHGALQSVPRGCVVRVALKDLLSPPGLQLSPLLTDRCPRSMSIPTLCENSGNYRRNNPSVGRCLSVSSQWTQASVPGRLNCLSVPGTTSRRSGLESRQTRRRSSSAFRGASSCDRSSLVMFLSNVLHSSFFSLLSNRTSQKNHIQCIPMDDCHKNCTSLLCWLKNLAASSEKHSTRLYLHLSHSTPCCPSCSSAILVTKTGFSSASNLQQVNYFSFTKNDLPLISKIITLQWREGRALYTVASCC